MLSGHTGMQIQVCLTVQPENNLLACKKAL